MKIKIYRQETYPDEITKIRERLKSLPAETMYELESKKYLSDRLSVEEWNPSENLGEIFSDLIKALEKHDIVAYHNTRLVHPENIYRDGLIFSDKRYLNKLKIVVLEAGMDEIIAVELERLVKKEQDFRENNHQKRINEVCFIFDMDYYQDYDVFLRTFGGEFVDNALYGKGENSLITDAVSERIKKLGVPCVIEFFFSGTWLKPSYQFNVARYMLEKWVCEDLRNEKGDYRYDSRVEREIPASQIIKVHTVNEPIPYEETYEK